MTSAAPRAGAPVWTLVAGIASAPLFVALCAVLWRTPYPISEAVALISDAAASAPARFFDPAARYWYRPLYNVTWTMVLRSTGSLGASLWAFRLLEAGSVAALGLLLLLRFSPRSWLEASAATFAAAVLIGMPGFRDNLEIPLLYTLIGMPIILFVFLLLEREHRWWHGPIIIGLMLFATGFKEQGLVIVPVVVIAWWMGAPGVRRLAVASLVLVTLAYLAFRFSQNSSWQPFSQEVGFGFSRLSPSQATARFGPHPLAMYAYNVVATVSNLLFSEPTEGTFAIVADLKDRVIAPWEVNHLLSSTALTVLIAWWGIDAVRQDRGRPWSADSRLFGVLVIATLASGALGFNYTRDRLGGMAVVFYALAAFSAVRAIAERAVRAPQRRMVAVAVMLFLLATSWQLRAIGTVEHARVIAWKNRREWITNLQARRVEFARQSDYMQYLNAMATQGIRPDTPQPTAYPAPVAALIGVN